MKILILGTVLLLLGACSSSGKKSAEKLYYRFPEVNSISIDKNIIIKRPSALGILGNRPMVVQTTDGALKQMSNNFWLDSPRVLLHNYLAKLFSAQPANEVETYVLNSQILKLEKQKGTTSLEIKFELTDLKGKQLFKKTYTQSTDVGSNSVPLFVRTLGTMLEKITQQLVKDIQ